MGENKLFLITVDTEGDNQWDKHKFPTTENARFLPRFQELCEKYHLIPTYLSDYEMVMDDYFVSYMKAKQVKNLCEIGMHLHAWHSPPEYPLNRINHNREYLIEYPVEIMEQKIQVMTELLTEKFGIKPLSHRSGRWAIDERYFDLLKKYGYRVDCSVTPLINWSGTHGATGIPGTDYTDAPMEPFYIREGLLEVPLTVRKIHCFELQKINDMKSLLKEAKGYIWGTNQWLRPDSSLSAKAMLKLVAKIGQKSNYLMFMIHSSELMPGGSPNFITQDAIDGLYRGIEEVFKRTCEKGYRGCSLKEFAQKYQEAEYCIEGDLR